MTYFDVLPWDSDFFGVKIGRASAPAQEADAWAHEQGLDCLYLLIPINEISEAHEATRRGFQLMDVRLQYEIRPRPERSRARLAEEDDLPRLREIARASFHSTRFYNDPLFFDARCDDFYETWTTNALADDTVLVVEAEQVDGYVTITDAGEIGLIAVAEEARRQGVGGRLLRGALDWAFVRRLETLTVVTQGGNIGAQRLFQHAGFRSKEVGLWFHKWADG